VSKRDWLSKQDPAPPPELANAMRTAVGEGREQPTANDLLESAKRLLDRVLRSDCETRASALDLLTVDALLTHSLLFANKDVNSLDDFPEQAMRRVTSAWK
jgi:hypothetical protein